MKVKITLPLLDGVTVEDVRNFYAAHVPNHVTVHVRYTKDDCEVVCPESEAGPINILYYSIPDYMKEGEA